MGDKSSKAHHTIDDNSEYKFNICNNKLAFVAKTEVWLVDSATQSHILCDRSLFTTYREIPDGTLSGAGTCKALG